MQLFDYDLQIDYWRNGRVEMRPWFYEMRSYEAGIRLFYFDGFSGFRAHPVRLVQGRTATMASLLTSRSLTWRRVTRVEQCERAAHLLGGRAPEKRVSSRKLQSTGESHGTNPHALAKTNPTVWMGRSCEGPCKRDPVENESTGRIPLQSAPDGTLPGEPEPRRAAAHRGHLPERTCVFLPSGLRKPAPRT